MIQIELEKHEAVFLPAETIAGTVAWSMVEGTSLEIRLIWYTAGKGDRDFAIVDSQKVATFESSGREHFQFSAPARPLSFSGKHISLQWAVEAIVFPTQNSQRVNFTISTSGCEIVLHSISEMDQL
jgi:hypothetical protein